jgi:hypothetical protein
MSRHLSVPPPGPCRWPVLACSSPARRQPASASRSGHWHVADTAARDALVVVGRRIDAGRGGRRGQGQADPAQGVAGGPPLRPKAPQGEGEGPGEGAHGDTAVPTRRRARRHGAFGRAWREREAQPSEPPRVARRPVVRIQRCSAACRTSRKPASTCDCACGGRDHGRYRTGTAANVRATKYTPAQRAVQRKVTNTARTERWERREAQRIAKAKTPKRGGEG